MRQSKFTETQIVSILKEADAGRPVNEIWRSYSISSATYYKWKAKYGGLEASDIKRLKELEHENSKLKRLYADTALENAALKDVLAKKNSNARRAAGGRDPHGHSGRPSDSAGVSGGRAWSGHVLSAGGQLGTARCPGH
jgi:putative transposase